MHDTTLSDERGQSGEEESGSASSSTDLQDQRQSPVRGAASSSDGGGGFWQRGSKAQQQSSTGTWDFETGPERDTGPATSSSSEKGGDKQMLYIQMEFCPRTLKKILLAGPVEEADAWQVTHSHCSLQQMSYI